MDEQIAGMYAGGFVAECNQVFAEMYGFATHEAMVGRRLVELHGGADVPENLNALQEFVNSGYRHLTVETVEVGADGHEIHFSNNSVGIIENGLYVRCWGTQRDISAQRLAESSLRHSRAQLRALLGRLRRAQEDERARVSREIHDDLGQLLTGLKLDVRWLERRLEEADLPETLKPVLDRSVSASELVDQAMLTVRAIAAKIRPGVLDEHGLARALRTCAQEFREHSEIEVSLNLCDPVPCVAPDIANELCHICQEALTNIARHSRAISVEIALQQDGDEIVLEIVDDGVGFNFSDSESRFPQTLGLTGMNERALQIEGSLEIAPNLPHGTRVTVRAPMRRSDVVAWRSG